MPDIPAWLPGFEYRDLDLTGLEAPEVGRPYDETSHPKICLHTTEGGSLAGAETAFARYPPHVGVDWATRTRRQYLPLDHCSFSLRGSESDDEFVVQVEIRGYAADAPGWPAAMCDWLGADVVAPIARAIGCPTIAPPQGFKGPGDVPYALASADSPLRFTDAELRAFSGVMGHQHAPAPDSHWDPGGLPIGRILAAAAPIPAPTPDPMEDDDVALLFDTPNARKAPHLVIGGRAVGMKSATDLGKVRKAFDDAGVPLPEALDLSEAQYDELVAKLRDQKTGA